MRRSGLLVYQILRKLGDLVQEGVSTYDLEVEAERLVAEAGAKVRTSNSVHAHQLNMG